MKKEDQDDIVYEEEESSSFKKPSTDKLKKALKACETEKKEYLEGWQKARADLVNLRKQDEEEKKQIRKYASEGVVTELISTLDSFEMAFGNKEAWESVSEEWRKGVEYIYTQLLQTLEGHGLSVIEAKGETFDPERHEAVSVENGGDNVPAETVIEVLQKGYKLNDKLLRPAKVIISS